MISLGLLNSERAPSGKVTGPATLCSASVRGFICQGLWPGGWGDTDAQARSSCPGPSSALPRQAGSGQLEEGEESRWRLQGIKGKCQEGLHSQQRQ